MAEFINITLKDLLNPEFYINLGGLWIVLSIIFAETGLIVGFFLPGDSLLFVSGIYSHKLVLRFFHMSLGSEILEVLFLFILISIAGVLGNEVGYWFGKRAGPVLFHKKDTFFFKKKHLNQAKSFYDKHGAIAIIMARFLPILRTFAPVVAGVVQMDKKKFLRYNIIGSSAWVFVILMTGHNLEKLFLTVFGFDLRNHLFVIVVFIVLITTVPVIYKILSRKNKPVPGV